MIVTFVLVEKEPVAGNAKRVDVTAPEQPLHWQPVPYIRMSYRLLCSRANNAAATAACTQQIISVQS